MADTRDIQEKLGLRQSQNKQKLGLRQIQNQLPPLKKSLIKQSFVPKARKLPASLCLTTVIPIPLAF